MTIYQRVKQVLEEQPATRNDYKQLIWQVYRKMGLVTGSTLGYFEFMNAPSPESIRRSAQAIFNSYPELRPSKRVKEWRKDREEHWNHLFNEQGQGVLI